MAAADPVGVDIDGRWFALFAVAFLLIPARRGKGASGATTSGQAEPSKPAKRSTEDPGPADRDDGSASRSSAPLALPAAGLDDLDAEVATEVLRVWAEHPAR